MLSVNVHHHAYALNSEHIYLKKLIENFSYERIWEIIIYCYNDIVYKIKVKFKVVYCTNVGHKCLMT